MYCLYTTYISWIDRLISIFDTMLCDFEFKFTARDECILFLNKIENFFFSISLVFTFLDYSRPWSTKLKFQKFHWVKMWTNMSDSRNIHIFDRKMCLKFEHNLLKGFFLYFFVLFVAVVSRALNCVTCLIFVESHWCDERWCWCLIFSISFQHFISTKYWVQFDF